MRITRGWRLHRGHEGAGLRAREPGGADSVRDHAWIRLTSCRSSRRVGNLPWSSCAGPRPRRDQRFIARVKARYPTPRSKK